MKKSLAAATVLSVFCEMASAQSGVTVYGLLDTGVEYLNHAGEGGVVRMSSGAMNSSRIGFRGKEDLGGGLQAIFQLENGFRLDSGAFDDASQLFNRQSVVGLEGRFGRVVAGRSFSTTYDFLLPFDPMAYSAHYSWVTSAGATGDRKDGMPTAISNLIKYRGDSGGFRFGAMAGLGESAGSAADSARYGVGLGYGIGPLSLAATYDRVNGRAAMTGAPYDRTATVHLAGSYAASDALKFMLGYRHYKKTPASGAADLRSDFIWGGGSYKLAAAWTLIGAFYYQNQKNLARDADPVMYALRLKYALSGRTDLYVSGAYAKAKNGLPVGLSRESIGSGDSQAGVTLGMQHRF